ncbi:MAG: hypothetical protein HC905_28770 [Bacteroidales bacterium]|nr:hypothetical protein [Bacteroidales bacterium]
MLVLLIISYATWDKFYHVGAKDEMKYFRIASEAATLIWQSSFKEGYIHILENYNSDISDTGFCSFQAIIILFWEITPPDKDIL